MNAKQLIFLTAVVISTVEVHGLNYVFEDIFGQPVLNNFLNQNEQITNSSEDSLQLAVGTISGEKPEDFAQTALIGFAAANNTNSNDIYRTGSILSYSSTEDQGAGVFLGGQVYTTSNGTGEALTQLLGTGSGDFGDSSFEFDFTSNAPISSDTNATSESLTFGYGYATNGSSQSLGLVCGGANCSSVDYLFGDTFSLFTP